MHIALLLAFTSILQNSDHFNLKRNGIALSGYDPVSYFVSEPTVGLADYQSKFDGVKYLFSSLENKETFDANPQKYTPAYGGWYAHAMGHGSDKVKVNPERYKIIKGKLYLF